MVCEINSWRLLYFSYCNIPIQIKNMNNMTIIPVTELFSIHK